MSKIIVQEAFGTASQKLAALVPTLEQHGFELTDAEFTKGFAFIEQTIKTVREQAQKARALAVASSGNFSFDMELPAAPAPSPVVVNNQPAPAANLAPIGQRAVGRIVKDPEAVSPEEAGQVLFDTPERAKPASFRDTQSKVDFIGDED